MKPRLARSLDWWQRTRCACLLAAAALALSPAAATSGTDRAAAKAAPEAAHGSVAAHPHAVRCHVGFAGASRSFVIAPSAHDAPPDPLLQGASFALEVRNWLPPLPGAGVQVRTYAKWADQWGLLHLGWFLHSAAASASHGFTGLQVVREPTRGHEISYWCERVEP